MEGWVDLGDLITPGRESNPGLLDRKSDALTAVPPGHRLFRVQGPGFICDADLVDIGVTTAEDRRQLLSAFSRLPPSVLTTR